MLREAGQTRPTFRCAPSRPMLASAVSRGMIVGFTRHFAVGQLLLGYYLEDGRFIGMGQDERERMAALLQPLIVK
jgi:hypothetical protein